MPMMHNRFPIGIAGLFAALTPLCCAQQCEVVKSVPQDAHRLQSGTATAEYEGTASVRGGQAVYVRIKNENALGVSYELTISEDTSPTVENCNYKAVLLPKRSVVLYGAVFTDRAVRWKIKVEVGEESDAGVLAYDIYSSPQ